MVNSINKTNTGNPEWMTPMIIINAAKLTMGSIDCDPASSDSAQNSIKAKQYYTKMMNGLIRPWKGNIWLNPPYHNSNQKQGPGINAFVDKLLHEIKKNNVKQSIFLGQSKTDTKWFYKLFQQADAIILTHGRIRFIDINHVKKNSPGYGNVFFYFGPNTSKFYKNFKQFGYRIRQ